MLTRKQFLQSALGIGAAAFGLTVLAACDAGAPEPAPDGGGGGGGSGSNSASCVRNGTRAMIGSNHGHVLVVTKEDVAAEAEKTYDIRGSASHTHTVVLSVAMFQQLADNHAVMVTSSTDDGHSHDIMIACA